MAITAETKVEAPYIEEGAVRLRTVSGPGPRVTLDVGDEPLTIGTSSECTLRLADPHVSGRHARIERLPDGIVYRDLGSTCGSYIRGLRIDTVFLPHDAPLTVGRTQLVLSSSETLCLLQSSPSRGFLEKDGDAQRFLAPLDLAAAMSHPVLLVAEEAHVAEFVADNLHAAGGRQGRALVVISCAGASRDYLHRALFGAPDSHLPGALELARGGTLMLSGCEHADPSVIEELGRAVTGQMTVRGQDMRALDVRLLFASTARQPWHWTPAGQMIARIFRAEALAIPRSLAEHLKVFLTRGGAPDPAPPIGLDRSYAEAKQEWVAHFEREFVRRALSETAGNVADAARRARMDRAYLFRLIRKHGLRGT